jgi:hypothetical protein
MMAVLFLCKIAEVIDRLREDQYSRNVEPSAMYCVRVVRARGMLSHFRIRSIRRISQKVIAAVRLFSIHPSVPHQRKEKIWICRNGGEDKVLDICWGVFCSTARPSKV